MAGCFSCNKSCSRAKSCVRWLGTEACVTWGGFSGFAPLNGTTFTKAVHHVFACEWAAWAGPSTACDVQRGGTGLAVGLPPSRSSGRTLPKLAVSTGGLGQQLHSREHTQLWGFLLGKEGPGPWQSVGQVQHSHSCPCGAALGWDGLCPPLP